jgi:formate/nitrite transporter
MMAATSHDQAMYEPALTTREFSRKISALGIKKANTQGWQLFLLALLSGLYISIGGHLFLVALEQDMGRIVGGLVFSVGLVLVVIAGAELFTGNIIMLVGAVTRQFSARKVLRNWLIVYLGNLIGAVLFAWGVWHAGLLGTWPEHINRLGALASTVAGTKAALSFGDCFLRGLFCNMLVILAIIMATLSKDIISKIACCMLPIMAFVACGFEHCVANMYLIPLGFMAGGAPWQVYCSFSTGGLWHNLVPVTLGNIVGGIVILFLHPNRIRQLHYLWHGQPQTP